MTYVVPRFQPLTRANTDPGPDGTWLGDIEGQFPLDSHAGVDQEAKYALPPLERRKAKHYVGIMWWDETQRDGSKVNVVCFACNLIWMGSWQYYEIREANEVNVKRSYIGPVLGGTGKLDTTCPSTACSCTYGLSRWSALRPATDQQVIEAVRRNAELSHQADLFELPTEHQLVHELVQTASLEAPGATIPPMEDTQAIQPSDRPSESKSTNSLSHSKFEDELRELGL